MKHGGALIASVAELMEGKDLGTYSYAGDALQTDRDGTARAAHVRLSSATSGSAVVGNPDQCIATAKRYEAAGCDLLLCLVNPYKIPHDEVMHSIELLGKHVIPAFAD